MILRLASLALALAVFGCGGGHHTPKAANAPKTGDARPEGDCKAKSKRFAIYDGKELEKRDYPYVGVLTFKDAAHEGICTASLVCADVVLTAAHCFETLDLAPGGYRFSLATQVPFTGSITDEPPAGSASGVALTVHPDRATVDKTESRGPDMALLQLDRGFDVPLAPLAFDEVAVDGAPKEQAVIVGYGTTGAALEGTGVKRAGTQLFAGTRPTDKGTVFTVPDAGRQTSCEGDSGGPLLVRDEVYGIISGGEVAECKAPEAEALSYAASVPASAAWLKETIKSLCGGAADGTETSASRPSGAETDENAGGSDCE